MLGNVSDIDASIALCGFEEDLVDGRLRQGSATHVTLSMAVDSHSSPESFLWALVHAHATHLPVFKIVAPELPDQPGAHTGANYYVAETEDVEGHKMINVFRGTFGYGGSGPHASALIEAWLKKRGLPLERQSADFLRGQAADFHGLDLIDDDYFELLYGNAGDMMDALGDHEKVKAAVLKRLD